MSRREFVKATAAGGLTATIAGCMTGYEGEGNGGTQAVIGTPASTVQQLPTTGPPRVVDLDEQGGKVTLSPQPAVHKAHPGESMGGPVLLPKVWAFQADDREPSVPGPVLRATEGQTLEITLNNTGQMPHTVHFHGVQTEWKHDGVPTTTGITVAPGDSHTYEIPANTPGTHLYHCHYQTHRHIDMGMYGILRVDPEGYEPADREYFMTLKEWDSDLNAMFAGADAEYSPRQRNPDIFTVNGKAAPRTLHPEDGTPILVEQGDTVRLHLVNGGYMNHPMHTHNHRFELVEKDGARVPKAARYPQDVVDVAPAERKTVEFTADADPGIYLAHCHKVNHAMNREFYPGGMVTGVVYKQAMDTKVFSQLMEYAGYQG
jgi:FtsP/CotA-like multicopper oxidase with cupredoxin domain